MNTRQYLEVTEIRGRSRQGATLPFICKASDGKDYFVKGKSASIIERIKEWIGGNLGRAFGLPIPPFTIVQADRVLLEMDGETALSDLGEDPAFASQRISPAHELQYKVISQVDQSTQQDILVFDMWVKNEDRTLTEKGGNPNLLWGNGNIYVIDHNVIFDPTFNTHTFLSSHVFREQCNTIFSDGLIREEYQQRMQTALLSWSVAWDSLPEEWCELNDDMGLFDPETTFEQLQQDAQGAIWRRLAE